MRRSLTGILSGFPTLLLLLAAIPGHANAAEKAERALYDIEVIAFERRAMADGEFWPTDPEPPDRSQTIGNLTASTAPSGITILPPADRRLGPTSYTLRKRGFTPVLHLAWRQALPERGSEKWYWVEAEHLRGRIRITRGRYLHFDSDLQFWSSDRRQSYRVIGNRRMRSAELHHLDHPRLGLLVQVDPYEPPPPAEVPSPNTTEVTGSTSEATPKPVESAPSGQTQ